MGKCSAYTYTNVYIHSHIHLLTHNTFAGNQVSDGNSFAHKLIKKRKYIMLKSFTKSTSKSLKCKILDKYQDNASLN